MKMPPIAIDPVTGRSLFSNFGMDFFSSGKAKIESHLEGDDGEGEYDEKGGKGKGHDLHEKFKGELKKFEKGHKGGGKDEYGDDEYGKGGKGGGGYEKPKKGKGGKGGKITLKCD